MTEEERIAAGLLFRPMQPDLVAIKLKTHNLCTEYNTLMEDAAERRGAIVKEIFAEVGEGTFLQGPIYIHYGSHTRIGAGTFINWNFTVQDDAAVTIGSNNNFGPNVTVVTPMHPFLPEERRAMKGVDGQPALHCYAKPVTIGDDCWICAGVTICSGVTIGDGCVIGAGSIVTRDIPAGSLAAGNPCRVIRKLTAEDSILNQPERLGGVEPLQTEN